MKIVSFLYNNKKIKESLKKMEENKIKIFVTGFFNSGKSTLVHTLDDEAIHVEKELSKAYDDEKTHTTTGFDLGNLVWARPNLQFNTEGVLMSKSEYIKEKIEYSGWHTSEIELKGCPGQMQFSVVRKILSRGSDGVLFLIDGCDLINIGNALVILEETRACLGDDIPIKIIANKSDKEEYHGADVISTMIGEEVYEGSAKYNIGVKDALIKILKSLSNYVNKAAITNSEGMILNGKF